MARILEDGSELSDPKRPRADSFGDRYPHYADWLDGSTWELNVAEDIGDETLNQFRASLYYQATVFKMRLRTRVVRRYNENDEPYMVLLVRAYFPQKLNLPETV